MRTGTFVSLCMLSALLAFASSSQTRASKLQENSNSTRWFEKREWLRGLALQPHRSINVTEFARQYHLHHALWDTAFAFFSHNDLRALPKGKYLILGDSVFASITEDPSKDYENTRWESHRKYADIQYVITGEEKIGVCPVSNARVSSVYDPQLDVVHYSATGRQYVARPGTFFIFLPTDAHRPNITTGGHRTDKKLVIKILVTK